MSIEPAIRLSPRLEALVACVPPDTERLIDVGCDHGWASLSLLKQGTVRSLCLIDIKAGPLAFAEKNRRELGLEASRVTCRLADGLNGVTLGDRDVVLISGLGGETIAAILEQTAPTELRGRFILQPQSKFYELRHALDRLSLRIDDEQIVAERKRLYLIITCVPRRDGEAPLTEVEKYFGPILLQRHGLGDLKGASPAEGWLLRQLDALRREARGSTRRKSLWNALKESVM